MTSLISSIEGQISASITGSPSDPMPIGSLVRSISSVPVKAYATTSGGDARYAARTFGCTRPSKLRLPDKTAPTASSCSEIAASSASGSGPELPMQVVQP